MSVYYSAAKINLFLQVRGKRPDGYHELTSVMQSVSLFDRLEVIFEQANYRLINGSMDLGPVEENIITRMWRLLKKEFNLPGEITVTVKKDIPVGAGLAGGSGNGAALLRAVNDYFDLDLSADDIVRISAAIGADIAFCYFGGTMLAAGIGEKLKPLPCLPDCEILLFNGGFHVSTPEVFRAYDAISVDLKKASPEKMLRALEQGSLEGVQKGLHNDLESVVFSRYPLLSGLSDALDCLALPHLMSGSGPSIFAFASSAAAGHLLENPRPEFGRMFDVHPLHKGIYTETEYIALQQMNSL